MKTAVPVSDNIDDGFASPFGPFGLERFKNEVGFKLHLQRRIKAGVRHKDVRKFIMLLSHALTVKPVLIRLTYAGS